MTCEDKTIWTIPQTWNRLLVPRFSVSYFRASLQRMAVFPTLPDHAAVYGVVLVIICLYTSTSWIIRRSRSKESGSGGWKKLPEPQGSWPVLGHLPLLGSASLPHRLLAALADRYGPAFSIRLGRNRTLVISSWELAKECFTTNDRVFASRPRLLAVKLMGYNHMMLGFAPYGSYWRDMRKLATVELLSDHRLDMLRHIRESEIDLFVRELYDLWLKSGRVSVQVDMKQRFSDLVMNVGVRTLAGKRYQSSTGAGDDDSRRAQKAFSAFLHLTGQFMYSDAVPSLGWLDVINGSTGKQARFVDGSKSATEKEILVGYANN